jgi:integrase
MDNEVKKLGKVILSGGSFSCQRNYIAMMFSIYTGATLAETLRLHNKDVYNYIDVAPFKIYRFEAKGKKQARDVKLHFHLRNLLEKWVQNKHPEAPLFPSSDSTKLSESIQLKYLSQVISDAGKEAGINMTHVSVSSFPKTYQKRMDTYVETFFDEFMTCAAAKLPSLDF